MSVSVTRVRISFAKSRLNSLIGLLIASLSGFGPRVPGVTLKFSGTVHDRPTR
jgi:hypothetical protein